MYYIGLDVHKRTIKDLCDEYPVLGTIKRGLPT
jgi:hypothetical protein